MMNDDISLVDIAASLPQVRFDLKYATADNLTGQPIYCESLCLLHPDAAQALQKSADIAALAGFTLLIFDAYRPQQAQRCLWQALPDPRYVRDPNGGSHHSRGVAVDVTLLDERGEALDMGSAFDEMTPLSHPYNADLPVAVQRRRLLLNAIMQGGGFQGIDTEWWHFELPHAERYPLLTDRFACFTPR